MPMREKMMYWSQLLIKHFPNGSLYFLLVCMLHTCMASNSGEAIDDDVRDPIILSDSKFASQPIQVMY